MNQQENKDGCRYGVARWAAALVLGGLTGVSAVAAIETPSARFTAQSEQFLRDYWRIEPEAAITAGRFEQAARQPILDRRWRLQSEAFTEKWLARFAQVPAQQLPVRQATDLALLKNMLQTRRWYMRQFREYEWNPAQYNIAAPIDAILNTDYAPKTQRLLAISQRLAAAPAYYAAARAAIVNPVPEYTQLAIAQSDGVAEILERVELAAQQSGLSPQQRQVLQRRCRAARTAVRAWQQWLSAQAPKTPRSFRIGKELYEAKFALEIQAGYSAEEMYRRALQAKEQVLEKMDALADTLWPKVMGGAPKPAERSEKIRLVIDVLSAQHVSQEQFFPEVRRQVEQLQQWVESRDLLTLDPDKPLIVRETPLYRRGVAAAGIEAPGPFRPHDRTYYNVEPMDGLPPAQIESNLREYNHWLLQILNIHEAIPGHYTQLIYANKSPSLVKTLFGNGAMVEGWAVYSERMMLESGYGGDTPEMWLMYYKWNLRVICNTILDYSVHVLNMSQEQALQLLMQDAFQTEAEARGKWRRVQLTSVQLTSYFSGFSAILALREQQKRQLGEHFKLKQFHENFLRFGSAPIAMIQQLMQTP